MNSSSPAADHPLFPSFFTPSILIPQGGDTFLVKPGKPIEKLTAKEVAKAIRKSVWTVYRMFEDGTLKGERPTKNGILIYAESLQAHLTASQDPEFWDNTRNTELGTRTSVPHHSPDCVANERNRAQTNDLQPALL